MKGLSNSIIKCSYFPFIITQFSSLLKKFLRLLKVLLPKLLPKDVYLSNFPKGQDDF